MHENPIDEKIIDPERIPLKERMAFQRTLIELMLPDRSRYSEEEWNEHGVEWGDKYAGKVSDIIDNPENEEIRELIMAGEYEKAAPLVSAELLKMDPDRRN